MMLSTEFITANPDCLNWIELTKKIDQIPNWKELYQFCPEVEWKNVSCIYQALPLQFIEEFKSQLDWCTIVRVQVLSEEFILKHLSEIESHRPTFRWEDIFSSQKLSPDFIRKYRHKVAWNVILPYQQLSQAFLEEFITEFDENNWIQIVNNQKCVSESFLRKHAKQIPWEHVPVEKLNESLISDFAEAVDWDDLSWQAYSTEFLLKYQERLNWDIVNRNKSLTVEQLVLFQDRLDWDQVSINYQLSKLNLEPIADLLNWRIVIQYNNITEQQALQNLHLIRATMSMKLFLTLAKNNRWKHKKLKEAWEMLNLID